MIRYLLIVLIYLISILMYIRVEEFVVRERYDNSINLGTKSIAWSNLNLLEALLGIKRSSIKVDFARKKLSLASYADVSTYIQNRLQ